MAPDGDFHTVEVALNRGFSNRWMFLASFLHTWAEAPAVLNFRTISGSRYNELLAILNPRVFRTGLRLEFLAGVAVEL